MDYSHYWSRGHFYVEALHLLSIECIYLFLKQSFCPLFYTNKGNFFFIYMKNEMRMHLTIETEKRTNENCVNLFRFHFIFTFTRKKKWISCIFLECLLFALYFIHCVCASSPTSTNKTRRWDIKNLSSFTFVIFEEEFYGTFFCFIHCEKMQQNEKSERKTQKQMQIQNEKKGLFGK